MTELVTYNCFTQDIGRGVHNLHTDVFKVAFSNRAPIVSADTVFVDAVEIAAGNGYPAGGFTLTGTSWTQTAGVSKFPGIDISITANTGPLGPFRYLFLYNDTAVGKPLVGYWDRGGTKTLDGTISEPFFMHFSDPSEILSMDVEFVPA